jgi:hypothetical protein
VSYQGGQADFITFSIWDNDFCHSGDFLTIGRVCDTIPIT